ncbi:ATP-dependent DNA helicase RecG [Benzoatithermus flavus]|uniref:Probable DNA 3'-5' helicase RecG n=1 Tax=Benzoatithermus flavus TaxID=3108223 RepID=A0ABU8XS96_9PROT
MADGLRPHVLDPLFAPVSGLAGVGPAVGDALARLLGRRQPRCLDLLGHLPTDAVDPTPRERLGPADDGKMVSLRARIEGHRAAPPDKRAPYRIQARAAGERIELVFFRTKGDFLGNRFAIGSEVLIHGQLGRFGDRWQMVHPDLLDPRRIGEGLLPVYPLVQGLTQGRLRNVVRAALARVPELPEWLSPELRRQGWPGWAEALHIAQRPATPEDLDPASPARLRLAFDELLANQLALTLVRTARSRLPGRALAGSGELWRRLEASLPFPLTSCQERAIAEIGADMAAPSPMLRLLQGDVGSGKTVVALFAMLRAVEAGAQAALMAPTEVLAQQHAATLAALADPLGLEVALLTGKEPTARRRRTLERLADGSLPLVVGTHALFQEAVTFHDLGLAVIDEQHRFGVGQRLDLVSKGHAVDVLLTTATPIPRSLVLAAYGDLATAKLVTKPPGRKPIVTAAVPNERVEEVIEATARALARGERIYWICPLVEESETAAAMAAIERHRLLSERFGGIVGLVHGRLSSRDKEAAIQAFARGDARLLVATTVIEVGVDVPDASIIVIEHAERFGLAQLHQLRGRVGRGERPSACLLLYDPPLSQAARARLAILRETEDGFRIAEEDLRLRGPGEVLGLRQSGLPAFRFADLERHAGLLPLARAEADRALQEDPTLSGERGRALRLLLHLFERQDAVRLLAAG